MNCVRECEFIGVVDNGHICKFHETTIGEYGGVLQRCKGCERHAYYNRLVREFSGILEEHNSYVSAMDKKIDDIHFLMKLVKETI